MPKPFIIYFPPRLVLPDFTKGDHNAVLDDARDRYFEDGICLVEEEESVKNAQKVINFEQSFPDLQYTPPDDPH